LIYNNNNNNDDGDDDDDDDDDGDDDDDHKTNVAGDDCLLVEHSHQSCPVSFLADVIPLVIL